MILSASQRNRSRQCILSVACGLRQGKEWENAEKSKSLTIPSNLAQADYES